MADISPTTGDDELDAYSFNYDPDKVLQPQRKWGWILACALLLIALSVAATLGITRLIRAPSSPAIEPTIKADVVIAGTVDETALLLIATDGSSSEIKFASTTTNTVIVQDLTRGRFRALAAGLSPEKDRVVYLHEEEGHRAAIIVDLNSGSITAVENDKLWTAAGGTKLEPCSWSPVSWSPDGARFCFFGCDRTTSVLVVVEAETELTPAVIKNTESTQKPPRQVFWLDNDSLLYTHFDPSTKQTWVRRIEARSASDPLPVYGR